MSDAKYVELLRNIVCKFPLILLPVDLFATEMLKYSSIYAKQALFFTDSQVKREPGRPRNK